MRPSNAEGHRKSERRAASAASSARWRRNQKERGLHFFQRWLTREQIRRICSVVRSGEEDAEERKGEAS